MLDAHNIIMYLLDVLEERSVLFGRDDAVTERPRESLYPTMHLGDVVVFAVDHVVNHQLSLEVNLRIILRMDITCSPVDYRYYVSDIL